MEMTWPTAERFEGISELMEMVYNLYPERFMGYMGMLLSKLNELYNEGYYISLYANFT